MGNYTRKTPIKNDCPIEAGLNVISGKWKIAILCELNRGDCRLKDFEKYNPEATKRALTQQLSELVTDGIIEKKDFNEFPKKVEYSLTERGIALIPVLHVLGEFGEKL
jgi:DNA-binding HxlR family transcriptional regulator